jgi:hypothetical protein
MRSRAITDRQRTSSPTDEKPHLQDHVSRRRRQENGTPTCGGEFSTVLQSTWTAMCATPPRQSCICHTRLEKSHQANMSDPAMTSPLAPTHDSDSSDAALVDAAVQGERSAQEQLIRRHQGFVHSLAQRMLYSPEDAADATQEILICIVTNLASVRALRIAPHSREFCGFAHRLPIPFHCPARSPYGRTLLRPCCPSS